MYFVNFLGTFQFCFRSSSLCTTYDMLFTSDMQSFSTLILSLAVESETADELMLISTESHTGCLCRSAPRERKGFEDSREVGEVFSVLFFFFLLFFLSPEYGRAHARTSNSSSINTRGSVVTFWLCVWAEGRVCCCGAQLGGSFVPPGEAQCGGSVAELNSIWSRNALEPCTWAMVQASCV